MYHVHIRRDPPSCPLVGKTSGLHDCVVIVPHFLDLFELLPTIIYGSLCYYFDHTRIFICKMIYSNLHAKA